MQPYSDHYSGIYTDVSIHDYIEVSKPRIVVVLVITAVTSLLAGSRFDSTPAYAGDVTAWQLGFLALTGAMASMGSSALNHYYDRDIDKIMDRTSERPIPAGRLPARNVLFYGISLCSMSVYTAWLKRTNASNIVIGGFAGSAASMAGWAAATGSINLLGFLIGWLVFMWTPPHFWCLAIRAREEYASIRVPMLPVLIGNKRTAGYIFVNTAILLPYSIALYFFGLGILYTTVAIISGTLMLSYHYKLTKTPTPEFAWKAYKITAPYLVIIFVAIAVDAFWYYRI